MPISTLKLYKTKGDKKAFSVCEDLLGPFSCTKHLRDFFFLVKSSIIDVGMIFL